MAQESVKIPTPTLDKVIALMPPIEVFRSFVDVIKNGMVSRLDLVSIKTNPLNGKRELFSQLGENRAGVWEGFEAILSELTGKEDAFEFLQNEIKRLPDHVKDMDYPLSKLTWGIASQKEGVNIGVEITGDGNRELSRTYYIFRPKEPIKTRIARGLGRILLDPQ